MAQDRLNCIHRWIINRRHVGTCTKCGEVRDFAELQNQISLENKARVAAAIRRKEANHNS